MRVLVRCFLHRFRRIAVSCILLGISVHRACADVPIPVPVDDVVGNTMAQKALIEKQTFWTMNWFQKLKLIILRADQALTLKRVIDLMYQTAVRIYDDGVFNHEQEALEKIWFVLDHLKQSIQLLPYILDRTGQTPESFFAELYTGNVSVSPQFLAYHQQLWGHMDPNDPLSPLHDASYDPNNPESVPPPTYFSSDMLYERIYPSPQELLNLHHAGILTLRQKWELEEMIAIREALDHQNHTKEQKEDLRRQIHLIMTVGKLGDEGFGSKMQKKMIESKESIMPFVGKIQQLITFLKFKYSGLAKDADAWLTNTKQMDLTAYHEIASNFRLLADLRLALVQQMEQLHGVLLTQARAENKKMARELAETKLQDIYHMGNMMNFASYNPPPAEGAPDPFESAFR